MTRGKMSRSRFPPPRSRPRGPSPAAAAWRIAAISDRKPSSATAARIASLLVEMPVGSRLRDAGRGGLPPVASALQSPGFPRCAAPRRGARAAGRHGGTASGARGLFHGRAQDTFCMLTLSTLYKSLTGLHRSSSPTLGDMRRMGMRERRWVRKWSRDAATDGFSPLPTQVVSNEEYLPLAQTREQAACRRAARRDTRERRARRLGREQARVPRRPARAWPPPSSR